MKSLRRFIAAVSIALATLASQSVEAVQIVVAAVSPLSGLDAGQGRAYGAGMQLYFDRVNKNGGVNGHTFALLRRDDGGVPQDTIALTAKILADEKPMVLAGYFGSRNIEALVASGILERENIALLGYRIAEVRAEHPHLFNVRASLLDEIEKFTEHVSTIGIKRVGLLYEDGSGAAALIAAVDAAAKKASLSLTVKAGYPARTAQVNKAVAAINAAAPQAIFMVATSPAAAAFIDVYSRGGAQLFTHSGVDIGQLTERLSAEQMQGVSIVQVTPSPYRFASRVSKEFRDVLDAEKPPGATPSFVMMEGFIAAKVIAEAVRRQKTRPSREGILKALESMDRYDLGGYVVGYKPDNRSGSRFVELSIISDAGKIRQ